MSVCGRPVCRLMVILRERGHGQEGTWGRTEGPGGGRPRSVAEHLCPELVPGGVPGRVGGRGRPPCPSAGGLTACSGRVRALPAGAASRAAPSQALGGLRVRGAPSGLGDPRCGPLGAGPSGSVLPVHEEEPPRLVGLRGGEARWSPGHLHGTRDPARRLPHTGWGLGAEPHGRPGCRWEGQGWHPQGPGTTCVFAAGRGLSVLRAGRWAGGRSAGTGRPVTRASQVREE